MRCQNCSLFGKCRAIREKSKDHFRWSFHNLIGHPLSEILWLIGLKNLSNKLHDSTIPEHLPEEGRG